MSVMVAAALDAGVGEPPARVHPVVWMGAYLDTVGRRVPAAPPRRAVAIGGVGWLAGAVLAAGAGLVVDRAAARAPRPWSALLRGTALWPLLSARLLLAEVAAVETSVATDLAGGREALSRIVGRDTAHLSAPEVRAAAVESLAENLSDALVAPLCWYLLAGLPGAATYRFGNTADACWGYRDDRWLYAGRVAARADDLLNLVPARLTALMLRGPAGWAALRREARRTASPNAGWPMAAMALRLDLRLTKRDHYDLHPAGRAPGPGDVAAALRAATVAAAVAFTIAAAGEHLTRPHRHPRQPGARR